MLASAEGHPLAVSRPPQLDPESIRKEAPEGATVLNPRHSRRSAAAGDSGGCSDYVAVLRRGTRRNPGVEQGESVAWDAIRVRDSRRQFAKIPSVNARRFRDRRGTSQNLAAAPESGSRAECEGEVARWRPS